MENAQINENEVSDKLREEKHRDRMMNMADKGIGAAEKSAKIGGAAAQAGGSAIQAGGKGVDMAGKGVNRLGQGMMRAGASLSSTGLGAIAGAPLAALGGATSAAGAGMQVGGETAAGIGSSLRQAGRSARSAGKNIAGIRQQMAGAKQASAVIDNLGIGIGVGAIKNKILSAVPGYSFYLIFKKIYAPEKTKIGLTGVMIGIFSNSQAIFISLGVLTLLVIIVNFMNGSLWGEIGTIWNLIKSLGWGFTQFLISHFL